jgi:DUF4097 and DUF4098 domain-containing protein YvlB
MKATMEFHMRRNSIKEEDKTELVTHQESHETLQSPLSKYQRFKDAVCHHHHHHDIPMPVPNADKIPTVTVIIADSPDNEDVIIKVRSRDIVIDSVGVEVHCRHISWLYLSLYLSNP